MSENAALGPSHVLENRGGTLTVKAAWGAQDTLVIGAQAAGVYPMPLYEGARVHVQLEANADPGPVGLVLRVQDPGRGQLRRCLVDFGDEQIVLEESRLVPAAPHPEDPVEILEALAWRAPYRFVARWNMARRLARWYEESDGIPALLGARVRPLGHQVYAARRVLWDSTPRFILADEVGLGKTIEAGLVIQALSAAKPTMPILVIAPGSMTRQWLCEIYLRFGARVFTHVDGARWRQTPKSQQRNLLTQPKLIVSATVLAEDPTAREALLKQPWGLVVIDEAHQLGPRNALYPFLRELTMKAEGVLALSATPSKREIEGMLGLLALVSPQAYAPDDVVGLERRYADKQQVWDCLSFTTALQAEAAHEGVDLNGEALEMLNEAWAGLAERDPVIRDLLSHVGQGQANSLDELVAYTQEYHRFDHRLVRTRRATLSALGTDFVRREAIWLDYEASAAEKLLADHLVAMPGEGMVTGASLTMCGLYRRAFTMSAERFLALAHKRASALAGELLDIGAEGATRALLSDPGPEEEELLINAIAEGAPSLPNEVDWLESAIAMAEDWHKASRRGDARQLAAKAWVRAHLDADPTHKVLAFTQDRYVAEAFAEELAKTLGEAAVAVFHHGLAEDKLSDVAQRFQRHSACRVLVSDELGGEGRNFQMASAVLHLDHPWSLARIEQRIGRLDRIGRAADRPVTSVLLRGPDEAEAALLDVHHHVFGVFERSVGGLEFALPRLQLRVADAVCRGASALRALTPDLQAEVTELLTQTDEDFERALDSSKPELKKAAALAEEIRNFSPLGCLQDVKAWARIIGIETSTPAGEAIEFKWLSANLTQPLPGVGVSGPGPHRFAGTFSRNEALQHENQQFFAPGHRLVDALVASLWKGAEGRATVFTRDLGAAGRGRLHLIVLGRCFIDAGDDTFPAGLMTRAHRRLWPDIAVASLALYPGQSTAAAVVTDPTLKRLLEGAYQGKALEPKIEPRDLIEAIQPVQVLWRTIHDAIPIALNAMREERRPHVERAVRDLASDWRYEMGYWAGEAARMSAPEAKTELAWRERLLEAARHEAIALDAIALVFGT